MPETFIQKQKMRSLYNPHHYENSAWESRRSGRSIRLSMCNLNGKKRRKRLLPRDVFSNKDRYALDFSMLGLSNPNDTIRLVVSRFVSKHQNAMNFYQCKRNSQWSKFPWHK